MAAPIVREREEETSRLSYVPVLTRAMTEVEQGAYTIVADAFRNIFAEKVRDCRIGRLVSEPMNFEGSSVKYARMGEEDIYSVEVMFNRQKLILTLRVAEDSTEMMLTDRNGKELEYLRQSEREIQVRRA